ncbi:MAG: ankyrin repeat domain-containing protein [Blastocatellia bacterium]|nr:ankyrin repeat domain-containing protein [Blastocatellia bacterium]
MFGFFFKSRQETIDKVWAGLTVERSLPPLVRKSAGIGFLSGVSLLLALHFVVTLHRFDWPLLILVWGCLLMGLPIIYRLARQYTRHWGNHKIFRLSPTSPESEHQSLPLSHSVCAFLLGAFLGLRIFIPTFTFLHDEPAFMQYVTNAAACNHVFSTCTFLTMGIDETERGIALAVAAEYGQETVLDALLFCGVSSQAKGLALLKATEHGETRIVRRLLLGGASVNTVDGQHQTSLMLAAQYGHVEIARLLLKSNRIIINTGNNSGETALMLAAKYGRNEIARLLLESSAMVDLADSNHETALTLAAKANNTELVGLLLEKSESQQFPEQPVIAAAERGHTEVVRLLLNQSKTDLYSVPTSLFKPIKAAITSGHHLTALSLLALAGTPTVKVDLLNEAISDPYPTEPDYHNYEVIRFFLNQGAAINQCGSTDETPLMRAVGWGSQTMVEALLEQGANVNQVNAYGSTALNFTSDERMKKLLRKYGARYGKSLPEYGC